MKIIVEGDKKHINNLIREKSFLVNRGSISIKVLPEPKPKANGKGKEKPEPESKK